MNRLELRKLSLEFRRLSSNLLNSTDDTADINLSRFLKFINGNELISGIIQDKISGVDYDFKECYDIGSADWADYTPPVDEACHIKAQYDYLNFINNENTVNVRSQAMNYCWSDKKINTIIQNFLDMAFKPLIDYINDQLSMEMIVYDEEEKAMGGYTYIQNIETVNGSASQQNSGVRVLSSENKAKKEPDLVTKYMTPKLKEYVSDRFKEYKSDLFASFLIRCSDFCISDGHIGMLTPYVWMFIQSYVELRKYIYNNMTFSSLIQLEFNAFESACVPVAAFTFRNKKTTLPFEAIRLSEFKGINVQEVKTLEAIKDRNCGFRFTAQQEELAEKGLWRRYP